jgi:hypothetical protein
VMLASRQIFPMVSIKWRPQEDLSSLSAEQASIIFPLSVSGAVLCDAGLTSDLPCGQHHVEAAGGLVLLVSRTGLDSTFLLSVSGVARCDAGLTPDLPCGQRQVEATEGLVLLVSRTGIDNIPTFCIKSGAV